MMAFDRITTLVDATAEPAFAREIADRTAIAEPTAPSSSDVAGRIGTGGRGVLSTLV